MPIVHVLAPLGHVLSLLLVWPRSLPGHAGPVGGTSRPLRTTPGNEAGQATTEYALVLLGAAAIALLLVAWATKTGAFGALLDAVMDSIKAKV
jgi:hypothetical protein